MAVIRRYNDKGGSRSLSYLPEVNRRELVFKSVRQSPERVQRSKKYRISGKMEIDVDELLKKDRITVEIPINSPTTPTYICTIQFNKVIKTIVYVADHQWYRGNVNLDTVEKALGKALDEEKFLKVNCTCPDFYYRYSYVAYRNGYKQGISQPIPAPIRNPHDNIGSFCKHLIMILKNRAWVRKLAQVVNYIIKQEYDKIIDKFNLDPDKFYINKSGQHNKSTVDLPQDKRSAVRKPRSRFLKPNDGEPSDEGDEGDNTENKNEGVKSMAVRLLRESFSPSLPDWVRDAVASNKYSFSGLPLDTVEFEERPIPKKLSDIQNDWEDGYIPVIEWDILGRKDSVSVITREAYTDSRNASYKFKATFKESLPYAIEDEFKDYGWKEIQPRILNYGVIANRESNLKSVGDKRRSRADAKSHIPKIQDPEMYMKGLKKDKIALGYKKQMDALYDEINDLFDRATEKISNSIFDTEQNQIFKGMQQIEREYNECLKDIDTILRDRASEFKDYDSEDDIYYTKYFKRHLSELHDTIDDFKDKWRIR